MEEKKTYYTDDKYILDEQGNPVPCFDLYEWAAWFEKSERRVAVTRVGNYRVSTVFLGLDYSFQNTFDRKGEDPILFETMVFGIPPKEDLPTMERYCTKEEAFKGHEKTVQEVQAEHGGEIEDLLAKKTT